MNLFARFLTILALFATVASAQTSTASISGVVSDSSGAVIAAVKVTATNEANGVSLSQKTTGNGVYSFPGLPTGTYTIAAEMTGFKLTRRTGNILDVESPLTANFTMEVGNSSETVSVVASAETLDTSDATVGNVVTQKEIVELPLNGRNPLGLLAIEPGVVQTASNATGTGFHVNGSRDMAHNNTIDGIDANESAVNSPMNNVYRLNPDAIQEYKVVTSNPTAEIGRNSGANTSIATRAGTNQYHGTAYEFLRNTDLDSNDFFANGNGTPKPDLKMNQFGVTLGGPIRKNKTFFFASWQDTITNYSEPISQAYGSTPTVYTPTALSGIYRYWVADPKQPFVFLGQTIKQNNTVLVDPHTGALRPGIRTCGSPTDANCVASFNMYANDPSHLGADPTIAKLMSTMPAPNLYSVGDGLNTAGYQWNSPIQNRGQGMLYRIDHVINDNENLFARYLHGTSNTNSDPGGDARPQLYPNTPPLGEVFNGSDNGAIGLHSVFSAHIFNELTAGVSRFSSTFTQGEANPSFPNIPAYCRSSGAFNNIAPPCRNVPETAREITTPQVLDNLTMVRGSHIIKTGINFRFYQHNDQRGEPTSSIAVTPTISFSSSLRPPSGFNLPATATSSVAGIASADSTRLQGTINDLMGIPASISQSFLANLANNTYLPFSNGSSVNLFTLQNRLKQYDSYVQDEWKVSPTFTLTAGVRWEANPAPTEANGPAYVPNQSIFAPNGLVSFVPESHWLKTNNLGAVAPRFGLAWNPLPKTVIRTGYAMAFDTLSSFQVTAAAGNVPGLTTTCVARPGVASAAGCPSVPDLRINQGFPEQLPPPTQQPSTFLTPQPELYSSAPSALTLDPYLKVPTVHMWNFTLQRDLGKGFVLQTGYVGKRGTRLYRAYDANQISATPILPDFLLMQQNFNAGCKPDGTGCPSGVKGQSIPLVTSGVVSSSFVNSTTTTNYLATNDAAHLAESIENTTLAAKLRPNQQFGYITYMDSGGDSYYHSLQTVLQKRFDSGLLLFVTYTFSKSIDDQSVDPVDASTGGGISTSTSTSRAPADASNWHNERGLSDFDRTHVLTATWVYQLPFGNGRKFFASMPRLVDAIAGGWSLKGIVTGMSGEPFSVRSGYFTNNYSHTSRADIVGPTPAATLSNEAGVIGPVYFVGDQNSFAIPAPGSDGAGRNTFRAAPYWNADLSVAKEFRLNERLRLEVRGEAFDALNHPNFENPRDSTSGSSAFTSTSFGRTCCETMAPPSTGTIISTGEGSRVIQFGLKLNY